MEVLVNAIVIFLKDWNAPLISIFIGLSLVYWELLKTNKKFEQIKSKSTKNGAKKPSDDFASSRMQDVYNSGFRKGYAKAIDDLSGDSTRKPNDESPKVS